MSPHDEPTFRDAAGGDAANARPPLVGDDSACFVVIRIASRCEAPAGTKRKFGEEWTRTTDPARMKRLL